jgi:hypothetical protein
METKFRYAASIFCGMTCYQQKNAPRCDALSFREGGMGRHKHQVRHEASHNASADCRCGSIEIHGSDSVEQSIAKTCARLDHPVVAKLGML